MSFFCRLTSIATKDFKPVLVAEEVSMNVIIGNLLVCDHQSVRACSEYTIGQNTEKGHWNTEKPVRTYQRIILQLRKNPM